MMEKIGRHRWGVLLVIWTIAIWGSRLRNALDDDELRGGERFSAVFIAAGFVVLAIVFAVALARSASWRWPAVVILGAAGIVRWTLRGPVIALSDEFETGFKVVHTVLWLVTVVLSIFALRETARVLGDAGGADERYDATHGSARFRN